MMEFETASPGTNEMDFHMDSHKRSCELDEDAESKKSKLDTSCDATIDTTAMSPKNPVSCANHVWYSVYFCSAFTLLFSHIDINKTLPGIAW